MAPCTAQNATWKSIRTKNTVSYTGMSSAGAPAPSISLTKISQKSVLSKSSKPKPKQKTEGIREIQVQEGETISKGVVRIFKLIFF